MTFDAGTSARAPRWGLLGCALLLLAGAGCTDDKQLADDMPTLNLTARVALADEDVGLVTETKNGEPCYELRTDVVKGAETSLGQYACLQPGGATASAEGVAVTVSAHVLILADHEGPAVSGTVTPVLIVRNRLAVGGAVAPSVAAVTVNGGPTQRQGPYFLAVLPTIPDDGLTVIGTDPTGKVMVNQHYPRALITSLQIPSQGSPGQHTPDSTTPPRPAPGP